MLWLPPPDTGELPSITRRALVWKVSPFIALPVPWGWAFLRVTPIAIRVKPGPVGDASLYSV